MEAVISAFTFSSHLHSGFGLNIIIINYYHVNISWRDLRIYASLNFIQPNCFHLNGHLYFPSQDVGNRTHHFILTFLSFAIRYVFYKKHRVKLTFIESEISCVLIVWSVFCYLVTCSLVFKILYLGCSLKALWGR